MSEKLNDTKIKGYLEHVCCLVGWNSEKGGTARKHRKILISEHVTYYYVGTETAVVIIRPCCAWIHGLQTKKL